LSTFLVGGTVETVLKHFRVPIHIKRQSVHLHGEASLESKEPDCEGRCLYPILVRPARVRKTNMNHLVELGYVDSGGGYAAGVLSDNEDEDEMYSLSQAYDIATDFSSAASAASASSDDDDSCEEGDFHTPSSRV
jgi:hypothetical protein